MRIAARATRHARAANSWSLRDIFILFALFRGFSEIRASDVIICPPYACGLWFIILNARDVM